MTNHSPLVTYIPDTALNDCSKFPNALTTDLAGRLIDALFHHTPVVKRAALRLHAGAQKIDENGSYNISTNNFDFVLESLRGKVGEKLLARFNEHLEERKPILEKEPTHAFFDDSGKPTLKKLEEYLSSHPIKDFWG